MYLSKARNSPWLLLTQTGFKLHCSSPGELQSKTCSQLQSINRGGCALVLHRHTLQREWGKVAHRPTKVEMGRRCEGTKIKEVTKNNLHWNIKLNRNNNSYLGKPSQHGDTVSNLVLLWCAEKDFLSGRELTKIITKFNTLKRIKIQQWAHDRMGVDIYHI